MLEEVRERPDMKFADSMARVHNPIQNNGPMCLSLACDNRKFQVKADGSVQFQLYDAPDGSYPFPADGSDCYRYAPQFGGGQGTPSRHLDGQWLPMPVVTVADGGVTYRHCTYVAPIDGKSPEGSPAWYRQCAACVVEYTITNTSSSDVRVSLKLTISKGNKAVTLGGLSRSTRARCSFRRTACWPVLTPESQGR